MPSPLPSRPRRSFVWRIVRVALITYIALLVLMMLMENQLIYFPAKYPAGDWQPTALPVEDAEMQAADGTRLHGWYIAHAQPRAVVLFLHGNAGNIAGRIDFLRSLRDLGLSVLALDYRGYGRSEGSPSEAGLMDDARTARRWLADRAKVREADIVLWGESIGTAVAVDLSTDGARGLILESAFTSLPDVAGFHYWWAPVRLLIRSRYSAIDKIGDYKGPLLQVHGDADTIIPFALGRKLFDAANEPKQFVAIPGADHNDPRAHAFWTAVDEFLSCLP
jgi:fermentation-respiration switch protein FrsA (DUF1100 family)